jgi:glycerol kinase
MGKDDANVGIMAIDIGTTNLKCNLFDKNLNTITTFTKKVNKNIKDLCLFKFSEIDSKN